MRECCVEHMDAGTVKRITDAAENLGWRVNYIPGKRWGERWESDGFEFEEYSPMGEDFIFTANGNDAAEIAADVCEFFANFDPGRRALENLNGLDPKRNYGYIGANLVRDFADDAEKIDDMIGDLRDALEKLANEIKDESDGEE